MSDIAMSDTSMSDSAETAETAATDIHEPCALLRLDPKLRHKILDIAIAASLPFCFVKVEKGKPIFREPPLLRTCRQLRAEATVHLEHKLLEFEIVEQPTLDPQPFLDLPDCADVPFPAAEHFWVEFMRAWEENQRLEQRSLKLRARKYGIDVATEFRKGSTPLEARRAHEEREEAEQEAMRKVLECPPDEDW